MKTSFDTIIFGNWKALYNRKQNKFIKFFLEEIETDIIPLQTLIIFYILVK